MAAEIRPCSSCGGQRGTEKEQHTVELDANGNQVARVNRFWSPCNGCGGTGTVVVG
jgi:DnaJ-class molecular chaperone